MNAFTHLPHLRILEIHRAAVDLGFAGETQGTLLAGLPPAFIAGLDVRGRRDGQLLDTLVALNAILRLEGGAVPLEVLLRNARQLSRERPEGAVFEKALRTLVGRRWMELSFERAGGDTRVTAEDSRGEIAAPCALDPDLHGRLDQIAASVRWAAAGGRPLDAPLLADAQGLHRALLGGERGLLLARLRAAASGPLLLRLCATDPGLQAIPWEAACAPGEAMGFWASSPDILPVRSVPGGELWLPRAVRGAVRVLAIGPSSGSALAVLRSALAARIDAGEIDWLDPLEGPAARGQSLLDRLRREPAPHVLHVVGRGGQRRGVPALRADDGDDEEGWLPVEILAQHLQASFQGALRLIVLECGEGAPPSAFVPAAEALARAGADAVVAQLWPVRADVARLCSTELYRSLAGADRGQGDIALSVNQARRAILGAFSGSAEAFSPVVTLRGPDGVIFDFKGRKVAPPAPRVVTRRAASGIAPDLARRIERPFSLLLGDRFKEQHASIAGFRERLHRELAGASVPVSPALPLSALAERFALHRGAARLDQEFQRVFRAAPPLHFIEALARLVGPGVHTTLLRHPWLEDTVAEQQPERPIYVIQPGEDSTLILHREGGGRGWEALARPPAAIDPAQEIILIRPYGGYTSEQLLARPLLTEDDYHLGVRELESGLPRDLANTVLRALSFRPALILGVSMHTAHHRLLLHRLYPRGFPRGSLAVIDPEDGERALWERGSGLPGKGVGVEVIESFAALDGERAS